MKETTYRKYLLTVLLVIQAFNYLDGLAMGLVSQNIKMELHLSDTELGFLTGIAFWLFYSTMGIPIARWADAGNRVTIISLTLGIWSVMVALCGKAANFAQLLLVRVCVAVGEAGCIPPAHSLISDYFTRGERPRALAIYMLGGPMSMTFGYFLAGWLNELYGWRAMFIMLGLPGLGLAAVAWLTLKEPRLAIGDKTVVSPFPRRDTTTQRSNRTSLGQVFSILWKMAAFRHLLISFAVISFFVSGILQWQPAFFVRSYGLKTGELGTWFAVVYGLGGMLGTYTSGELVSRFATNNECLQLRAMAVLTCVFGVFSALIYLAPNRYWAFGLLAIAAVTGNAVNGPVFAAIQSLVPSHMRATSIALIYLVANLVGTGLGPLAVGALSDAMRPWAGDESLRYALLVLCPGYLWGGWHLWRAGRTVGRDLETSQGVADTASADAKATVHSGFDKAHAYPKY
jgi:MFS family permease